MEIESSIDVFSLWQPPSLPVLEQILSNRTSIVVFLSHGLTGRSLAQRFKGRITKLNGNQAHFSIESQETVPTTNSAKMAQGTVIADIFFNLSIKKPDGLFEPLGYSGEANLMNVITNENAKPVELVLRIAHGFSVRRLRRDVRMEWREDIASTLGLDSIPKVPENIQELKLILDNCVNNTFAPKIVNISAGGACVCLNMATVKKTTSHLYFFVLTFDQQSSKKIPFFFVAKKVGLYYGEDKKDAIGLRLQFQHELDWANSKQTLQWNTIEKTGSEQLRSFLGLLTSQEKKQ